MTKRASNENIALVLSFNQIHTFRSTILFHRRQHHAQIVALKMASRVLDEFIIQEVARTCPESFLAFHKCMEDPAIRDKNQCDKHQLDLQRCIKNEVTVYQRIEKNCADVIMKYQDCLLKDTEGNSSSKCYTQLTDLRSCAMNIIDTEQKNSAK